MSCPCFELWLLLHFAEPPLDVKACKEVTDHLTLAAGGYSKTLGCTKLITTEMILAALERASRLDTGTSEIPSSPMTRIYQILNLLIARESIQLKH